MCERIDVLVQETETLDVLSSCVRSVEYLRKQCTEAPSANMQSDDHVSCVKSDLLNSCGTFRVLVGVTGSVAALKLPVLVSQLLQLSGVSSSVFIYSYDTKTC